MKKKGFTLIELLIVVAIIAILAAIAVPNFLEAQVRSKVSRCKADIRSLATALESYVIDNNHYPNVDFLRRDQPRPQHLISYVEPSASYPAAGGGTPLLPRLIALTTPIAYITSIPGDPFNPGKDPFSRDWPNCSGNAIFTYGTAEETADNLDNSFDPSVMRGYAQALGKEYDPKWVLFAYGPQLGPIWDKNGVMRPAGEWYLETVYDPTNGTQSTGVVVRVGP